MQSSSGARIGDMRIEDENGEVHIAPTQVCDGVCYVILSVRMARGDLKSVSKRDIFLKRRLVCGNRELSLYVDTVDCL